MKRRSPSQPGVLGNPLKYIDDLKSKGVEHGWGVRLPESPGKTLNKQFLTRDHKSYKNALKCALRWRDQMCTALPFPLHARVSQYLDGTHKVFSHATVKGKPAIRAQFVEFDVERGEDRAVNVYRVVHRPEDYQTVYATMEALVRPRIIREAKRIAALAAKRASGSWTPVPVELQQLTHQCQSMFDTFDGQSLQSLQEVLLCALAELAEFREQAVPSPARAPRRA